MKIRECLVESFVNYPLFQFVVPDNVALREKFLRAYFNANYEVVTSSENIIVLVVKINEGSNFNDETTAQDDRVIGGALFLPPASSKGGWAFLNTSIQQDPFWKAYEGHGLEKISQQGFHRLKRWY